MFNVYIATEPKNIKTCLEGFKVELDKIKNIPVTQEELENAKNNLIGKRQFFTETNLQQSSLMAFYEDKGLGANFEEKLIELVEQYIKGQDISMIYVEGLGALGPCFVNCDSEFYDYELISDKDDTVDISTLDGNFDELKMIVENIARKLDIKGYAKLDFRISDGKFYLIEVNAQVSFHPEGEFITCAKKDNYSFEQIINFIVKNALQHENKINSVGIVGDINE